MQILQGKNIRLRPITEQDTADIIRWRNTERVRRNFVYREEFTEETHLKWLRDEVESGNTLQWVICEGKAADTARAIGSVFVKNIRDAVPEYGIFIGEDDACGKGYASEAAKLVTSYCLEQLHCSKLGLRVYTDNTAAIRSYEAAGFKPAKTLSGVVSTDGETKDMVWMELTSSSPDRLP